MANLEWRDLMESRARTVDQNDDDDIAQGLGRLTQIRNALSAGISAYNLASSTFHSAKDLYNNRQYTVTVQEHDELFWVAMDWVVQNTPQERRRAIRVLSQRGRRSWMDDEDERDLDVYISNVSNRAYNVQIGQYRVKVAYNEPEFKSTNSGIASSAQRASLLFTCRTAAARDAVVGLIKELAKRHNRISARSRVFRATSFGSWVKHDAPLRTLDTVVLPDGVKEDVIADFEQFLAHEEQYARLGLPWHRGYLFYGPPGTGKTSLARGIAAKLGLDLYYVSLSDLHKDSDLPELLGRLQSRSILLLEDVDVLHAATERMEAGDSLTLAGLLNALDGAVTPHGLITVMTTNNIEVLDAALIRPGRADRQVQFDYLTARQTRDLMEALLGDAAYTVPLPSTLKDRYVTAADVVEVVKRHIDGDPKTAAKEIAEMIERTPCSSKF